jgi:hypothetical protein
MGWCVAAVREAEPPVAGGCTCTVYVSELQLRDWCLAGLGSNTHEFVAKVVRRNGKEIAC